jgi:hypothetical protein
MRYFSIDQHISGISDLKQIFAALGHTIDDVCMSGHAGIIGRAKDSVPMLDGDGWCNVVHDNKWSDFFDLYNEQLKSYDGFICFYPPIFARLYERFNKPIIIQIPIRYEYGINSAKEWIEWNNYLRNGIDTGKIFVCANSLYDKKYTEYFLGREVAHIPNLCEYTGMHYRPITNHYLYYAPFHDSGLDKAFVRKYEFMSKWHDWNDFCIFKGIMHYPYNISTMSIFEQYTANIPLLFPSKSMLLDMYAKGICVLNQMSWNRTYNKPPGSMINPGGGCDPNKYDDFNCMDYWLQFADFYNQEWMPNIIYFNSIDELNDLAQKLSLEDLRNISKGMEITNRWRKVEVYNRWRSILGKIQDENRG